MRRHALLGYFGPSDRPRLPIVGDEVVTLLDLITSDRRLGHGIGNAIDDLGRLGVFPSEIGLDILVLAALVYAADTRISRTTESQDTWTREIRLDVPVSNPERWTGVVPLLKRMLDFLTGDRWALGFRPRPRGFSTIISARPRHRGNTAYDSLALFSGGLDSLIHAINTLEGGGRPLLVSHASDGATSDAQYTCFESLAKHYTQSPFNRLRAWISFPERLVRGVDPERTTRARSFLFFALGVFAGTGLGGGLTLQAPENGFIALNVPLDPLRLGALSTRTMHPFYLARWNELLATLGVPGRIENPYWDKTKAEMVISCSNSGLLLELTPSSLSCSSPTKGRWQGRGIEHCGYCVPCLIRRAALKKGLGRTADPTSYTLTNLTAHVLDTRQSEGQQVRSFQYAIERLRANPGLARLQIHKPGPLTNVSSSDLNVLADVYRRGIEEVAALLAHTHAQPA